MKELNELIELAKYAVDLGVSMDRVDPETILSIAEAFRALEQRAEAAEAKLSEAEHRLQLVRLQRDKQPVLEHVASLTLKDSQYEWEPICYIPDGEHDLYIVKESDHE